MTIDFPYVGRGANQHMENSICFVVFLNESIPNFFLFSEIIYSVQVKMGFEIEYLKALNPLTLMVKILLLTLTGVKMFISS